MTTSPDTPAQSTPETAAAAAAAGAALRRPTIGSWVPLRPALPCVDSRFGAGFVDSLAESGLCVRFASGEPQAGDSGCLRLATEGGLQYELTWQCLAAPPPDQDAPASVTKVGTPRAALLQIVAAADLIRLADLLTLVRKNQHIEICANQDVEATDRYTGFSDLSLVPCALPDLAWADLDTSCDFLGRRLALPLLITGMTGGLARGAQINERLARAAAAFGIPMGVGSQRIALDTPRHAAIFTLKRAVPGLFLIGNLGIAQLRDSSAAAALELCERAVAMIEADALALHVNVLQELIQVEGDRDFRGILARIAYVASRLSVPVIVKEVGAGIDATTARHLREAGVRAIDAGGKGGTSWCHIEGERAASATTRAVAATFRDWGIPTAQAIANLRQAVPELPLIATGGIRDGLTVAKAVALGATCCGIGLPLLRAAMTSEDAPHTVLATFAQELRTAMMITGTRTLPGLQAALHVSPRFLSQMAAQTQPNAAVLRAGGTLYRATDVGGQAVLASEDSLPPRSQPWSMP